MSDQQNKFEHCDDYEELIGGEEIRKHIGDPYKALISSRLQKHLIFAIIETVNLNVPDADVSGKGTTYIYSYSDNDEVNYSIIKEYDAIIDLMEEEFTVTISAYEKWYNLNTFLHIGRNENPELISPKNSGWRQNGYLQRKEKPKEKYGYIKDEVITEKHIEEEAKKYLSHYVNVIKDKLSFSKFPHYAVIVRPIAIRTKAETIKLGNMYLHFATDEEIDKKEYLRLLNDFLLIWSKEEGRTIVTKIKQEAKQEAENQMFDEYKTGYPAIWTLQNELLFSKSERDKINEYFGEKNHKLHEYFDRIFKNKTYTVRLQSCQEKIKQLVIPCFLYLKNWLKQGVVSQTVKLVMKELKPRAQHNKYTDLSEPQLNNFIRILVGRHIFNIGTCVFGFTVGEMHEIFRGGLDGSTTNLNEDQFLKKTGPYFSQYFFYCPIGKNLFNITLNEIYLSTSLKERKFLDECVELVSNYIDPLCVDNFNYNSCDFLKIDANKPIATSFNKVSKLDIFDFKQNWCNENKLIPKLLKEQASEYLVAPILDCGAGLGDIAFNAFPDKQAMLIDVNSIIEHDTKISPLHTHKVASIFDFVPEVKINTLLISHTLQFIDDDLPRLSRKIAEINPEYIILVLNRNDDIMGELIKWSEDHYEKPNPERIIDGFPEGYTLATEIPFKATVDCKDDFDKLAKQISYLMLFDLEETGVELKNFLKKKLRKPTFTFNQVIQVFSKSIALS